MSSRKKHAAPPHQPAPAAATPAATFSRLDVMERFIILAFYAWFFWRFGNVFLDTGDWRAGLALVAESVTVVFLIIRRPAHTISPKVRDWLLALVPTVLPLRIEPFERGDVPLLEAFFLGPPFLIAGTLGAIACKFALGRSFGLVAANRGLQTSGPYRLVRHPMYACYIFTHLGIWFANPLLWNLGVYAATWALQITRILVEEQHLSQDPAYREYKKVVRYRLIPGLF
jgi:protein-S-isoprenylcysteine O-methyltransferase Ste14